LFEEKSPDTVPLVDPVVPEPDKPPDIDLSEDDDTVVIELNDVGIEFNSFRVSEDVSSAYKKSIMKKDRPTVRFFRRIAKFVYGSPEESEILKGGDEDEEDEKFHD
jgi:hypothetical protein